MSTQSCWCKGIILGNPWDAEMSFIAFFFLLDEHSRSDTLPDVENPQRHTYTEAGCCREAGACTEKRPKTLDTERDHPSGQAAYTRKLWLTNGHLNKEHVPRQTALNGNGAPQSRRPEECKVPNIGHTVAFIKSTSRQPQQIAAMAPDRVKI